MRLIGIAGVVSSCFCRELSHCGTLASSAYLRRLRHQAAVVFAVFSTGYRMTLRRLMGCIVALAVALIWLHSLGMRLPYMDQIPVYDSDVATSVANMWARMWCDEGPLKMWFSTPRARGSIEAPERWLYESWPPGTF